MKNIDKVITRFLDTFENYKDASRVLQECFDSSEIMDFYERTVKFIDPKLMVENERDSLIDTFVKAYSFRGNPARKVYIQDHGFIENKEEKIEKLDNLVRTYYTDLNEKEEAILDALQKVNGMEKGTLDYVGYSISGNYKFNLDDAIEFICDEQELEKTDELER